MPRKTPASAKAKRQNTRSAVVSVEVPKEIEIKRSTRSSPRIPVHSESSSPVSKPRRRVSGTPAPPPPRPTTPPGPRTTRSRSRSTQRSDTTDEIEVNQIKSKNVKRTTRRSDETEGKQKETHPVLTRSRRDQRRDEVTAVVLENSSIASRSRSKSSSRKTAANVPQQKTLKTAEVQKQASAKNTAISKPAMKRKSLRYSSEKTVSVDLSVKEETRKRAITSPGNAKMPAFKKQKKNTPSPKILQQSSPKLSPRHPRGGRSTQRSKPAEEVTPVSRSPRTTRSTRSAPKTRKSEEMPPDQPAREDKEEIENETAKEAVDLDKKESRVISETSTAETKTSEEEKQHVVLSDTNSQQATEKLNNTEDEKMVEMPVVEKDSPESRKRLRKEEEINAEAAKKIKLKTEPEESSHPEKSKPLQENSESKSEEEPMEVDEPESENVNEDDTQKSRSSVITSAVVATTNLEPSEKGSETTVTPASDAKDSKQDFVNSSPDEDSATNIDTSEIRASVITSTSPSSCNECAKNTDEISTEVIPDVSDEKPVSDQNISKSQSSEISVSDLPESSVNSDVPSESKETVISELSLKEVAENTNTIVPELPKDEKLETKSDKVISDDSLKDANNVEKELKIKDKKLDSDLKSNKSEIILETNEMKGAASVEEIKSDLSLDKMTNESSAKGTESENLPDNSESTEALSELKDSESTSVPPKSTSELSAEISDDKLNKNPADEDSDSNIKLKEAVSEKVTEDTPSETSIELKETTSEKVTVDAPSETSMEDKEMDVADSVGSKASGELQPSAISDVSGEIKKEASDISTSCKDLAENKILSTESKDTDSKTVVESIVSPVSCVDVNDSVTDNAETTAELKDTNSSTSLDSSVPVSSVAVIDSKHETISCVEMKDSATKTAIDKEAVCSETVESTSNAKATTSVDSKDTETATTSEASVEIKDPKSETAVSESAMEVDDEETGDAAKDATAVSSTEVKDGKSENPIISISESSREVEDENIKTSADSSESAMEIEESKIIEEKSTADDEVTTVAEGEESKLEKEDTKLPATENGATNKLEKPEKSDVNHLIEVSLPGDQKCEENSEVQSTLKVSHLAQETAKPSDTTDTENTSNEAEKTDVSVVESAAKGSSPVSFSVKGETTDVDMKEPPCDSSQSTASPKVDSKSIGNSLTPSPSSESAKVITKGLLENLESVKEKNPCVDSVATSTCNNEETVIVDGDKTASFPSLKESETDSKEVSSSSELKTTENVVSTDGLQENLKEAGNMVSAKPQSSEVNGSMETKEAVGVPKTNGIPHESQELNLLSATCGETFCRKFIKNSQLDNVTNDKCSQKFAVITYNLKTSNNTQIKIENLMDELKGLDASIICLQEVDWKYFETVLQPSLKEIGYTSVFHKSKMAEAGLATFYLNSHFELKDHRGCDIHEVVQKDVENSGLDENEKEALCKYLHRPTAVLYTSLKILSSNKCLYVCNTNVPAEDLSMHALQVAVIVRELTNPSEGAGNPHILCGTFNMEESYPGYQLLKDGYLNNEMIEDLQSRKDVPIPNKENAALVNLLWKCFQHPSPSLKSSYKVVSGHELALPGSSQQVYKDFVWFSSDTLSPLGVLNIMDSPDTKKSINSHLSLKVELGFNN